MSHEHGLGRRLSAGLIGSPVLRIFWLIGVGSLLMIYFAERGRWGLFSLMVLLWFAGLVLSLLAYRRGQTHKTFLRLTEKKFRVTADSADLFYLTCGACQHAWDSPGALVREYRKLFGPEAARRVGAALPRDQERARLGVRCPACGAVDPGVLVAR